MDMRDLEATDPEIADLIRSEEHRQFTGIELIASENYISAAVAETMSFSSLRANAKSSWSIAASSRASAARCSWRCSGVSVAARSPGDGRLIPGIFT